MAGKGGVRRNLRTVARDLGVRYLLEGSVRRFGKALRVSVQFIEADTGRSIWSENFNRDIADIFDVQDEIAQAVAGATISELTQAERDRAQRIHPQNLDAWECYQHGLKHMYRFEPDGFAEARTFFQRAIDLDGELTLAHTGLAYTLVQEVMYSEAEDPARLIEIQPGFTCALARRYMQTAVNPIIDQLVDGLRRAGLPA